MKALALDYQHRSLQLRDISEPSALAPEEVCFRVHEVGICGTDRDLARFKFGYPPPTETYLILGHESLGQVVATGPAVNRLNKGDWVVPTVRRGCSHCGPCTRNRSDLCVTGDYMERGIMGAHGYMCDFAVDHQSNLVHVPEHLAPVAVLAEPLSVVEKAAARGIELRQEPVERALILGAGPIGILTALLLRHRGIQVTIQSMEDPSSARARLVERAGARYVQNSDERYDLVIEAAGSAAAAYSAIKRLGPLGVCVLLGAQNGAEEICFRNLILGNQTIVGSVNAAPESFARAVADLSKFDASILASMITRSPIRLYGSSFSACPSDSVKQVHVLH